MAEGENTDEQKREQKSFRDFCSVFDDSLFAGVKVEKGEPQFCFPRGYPDPRKGADPKDDAAKAKAESELKDDFFRLLRIIEEVKKNYGDKLPEEEKESFGFPIRACIAVLQYWLDFGYFMETETVYKKGLFGKISWPKTIKRIKPQVVKGKDGRYNIVYLDLISRLTRHNEDNLITLIHKYCVHYAAKTIGPLLGVSESELDPPELDFDYAVFSETLNEKISTTFNDRFLELFQAMKEIVEYLEEKSKEGGESADEPRYGVKSFAYAWELMVDRIFGNPPEETNKSDFNPHLKFVATGANDKNGESFGDEDERKKTDQSEAAEETHRSTLRPDTIMFDKGDCFILDSKYYKFGLVGKKEGLPGGDSITKQIAYAEYIDRRRPEFGCGKVYNAFILPYRVAAENAKLPGADTTIGRFDARFAGYIYGDWKDLNRPYHKIICILLDMKSAMRNYAPDKAAQQALAQMIRDAAK